jgi:hypothetical protein
MDPADIKDFELRISSDGANGYQVEVLHSPAGESKASLELSLQDPEFRQGLDAVQSARGAARDTRDGSDGSRDVGDGPVPPQRPAEAVNRLGVQLFRSIFHSDVGETYRTSLQQARDEQSQLRIRFRVDEPELATIPWEFLYDDREGDPLCLVGDTHLVRYLPLGRPQETLTVTPPLRILGMVSNPAELAQLDTEGERRLMTDALDHLIEAGTAAVEWVEGGTWRDLEAALRGGPWHVFHFIGHGDFDTASGEGYVALCDEQGGVQKFDATRLGRMLADHKSLRLAVLNCCKGAVADENSLVSSVGAKLMQRGLPAVVSMQYSITDKAALEFSRQFYTGLADQTLPIDVAVTQARKTMTYAIDDTVEWATPVLHMRAPDGRLFDFDTAGAVFATPDARQGEHVGRMPAGEPPPRPEPDEKLRQRLLMLLQLVRRSWIDGVLDVALAQGEVVDLQFRAIPKMVDSPWGSTPIEEDKPVLDIFDDLGGSFLILGVPGSGKTILMLTLARDLLSRAEQDAARSIPVVVNLSSWRRGADLAAWFAGELSEKYAIPRKVAGQWLQERRLLLLLDGLDEIGAHGMAEDEAHSLRADCVRALNGFIQEMGPVKMVVCCRYKEYTELPEKVSLNGAVNLRSLTPEQVMQHIDRAGDQLAGLKAALRKHSELRILAQTPFHLNTMIRTYWGQQTVDLKSFGIASKEQRNEEVMENFVARQFERVGVADA